MNIWEIMRITIWFGMGRYLYNGLIFMIDDDRKTDLSKIQTPIIAVARLSIRVRGCWLLCLWWRICCRISLQCKLIVLLCWFIWLVWILIGLQSLLISLDSRALLRLLVIVEIITWGCFNRAVYCWVDAFWFESVSVLCYNIISWCVHCLCANT